MKSAFNLKDNILTLSFTHKQELCKRTRGKIIVNEKIRIDKISDTMTYVNYIDI